jgi:hypothetical protein
MRALLVLVLLAAGCSLAQWLAPAVLAPAATVPVPITPTPTLSVPLPHVEISASATALRVGDTLTIRGVPVNLGLPIYTLTLSSGATASVTYDNQPRDLPASDGLFEIVAAQGEMNAVTFTLRALAAGTAEVSISATGEARTPEGAFMWSGGGSSALTLTVSE